MKSIRLHARGGPEAFVYEDAPDPTPGAGNVLVRVHAAGVTPTELQWVPTWSTRGGGPRPFPIIPGHELSGIVAALGPGVDQRRVGEAVYGINDWFRDGALAELCVVNADALAPKPRNLDHVAAAAVPISALTAWQGLIDRARLTAGQRVLVHGGAGAVGGFAVQIARWRGARVLATASACNLTAVQELGAWQVIDYRATRFEDVVGTVDVVFDTVGGDTLRRSQAVLKPGGRLITIAAQEEATDDPVRREAFFIVEANTRQLSEIAALIDDGYLHPVVDAVFPLAEARQAFERKPTRGKVVLRVAG